MMYFNLKRVNIIKTLDEDKPYLGQLDEVVGYFRGTNKLIAVCDCGQGEQVVAVTQKTSDVCVEHDAEDMTVTGQHMVWCIVSYQWGMPF